MSETPTNDIPPDPIYAKSLSWPIAVASLAVLIATALAIWDEGVRRRPYKGYQAEFKELYGEHLQTLKGSRENAEKVLENLDEYQGLTEALADANEAAKADIERVGGEAKEIANKLRALNGALKNPKAEMAAANYLAEHSATGAGEYDVATSAAAKPHLADLDEIRARTIEFSWETASGENETASGTVAEFLRLSTALQTEKAQAQQRLGAAQAPVLAAKRALDTFVADNLGNVAIIIDNLEDDADRERIGQKVKAVGADVYLDSYTTALPVSSIDQLISENDDMWTGVVLGGQVHEIFLRDANNWVDRCTTCHMGTLSPVPLTPEDMGGNRLYMSHPRKELLDVHDPEQFGCSTCHNGNGVAITTVEYAHGLDEFWLHKLYPPENIEAGCVQCHDADLVLPMGERITSGKETFGRYGCWGCHERDHFNEEPPRIDAIKQRLDEISDAVASKYQRSGNLNAVKDPVFDLDEDAFNEITVKVQREQVALQLEVAALHTERDELLAERAGLYQQKQKVGPSLKELAIKTSPEWVYAWLRDQYKFRPDTKMPKFRFFKGTADGQEIDEYKEITAFIWQSALDPEQFPELKLPQQAEGNVATGKELFESVGCVACHGFGEGEERIGNDFSATLNNLGEKVNQDWLVRWLKNPRGRLVPFHPELNRDLTKAERERLEISDDSLDLVWANHTVMPSLRLSDQEARDIASYLRSHKRPDSETDYQEAASWVNDEELAAKGRSHVLRYGCAGCHEITGLENEKGIGTALSIWGSRPIELLDFGHYLHDAHRGNDPLAGRSELVDDDGEPIFDEGGWYNLLEFEKHKIAVPDLYEEGKNLSDPTARLRMPKFGFTGQQVLDVAGFVTGSVESKIPEAYRYNPDARGKAIQEGWWVVRKYNCQGCHDITPEFGAALPDIAAHIMKEPQRMDALPPSLVGTGFRTQPLWLARFLEDPSLGGGTKNPKAARLHLSWRMPTFDFSDGEIRTLVAFFDALASQNPGYVVEAFEPLTPTEYKLAEGIFKAANCTQCHVVEGMPLTPETKAPNLSLANERLRPEWMRRWIREPALWQPGTAMLKLFEEHGDRWTYPSDKIPGLADYEGDHIDLMIRYLRSLDAKR